MTSEDIKSMVAQNCEEYEPPEDIRILSNSMVSISCENCASYMDGQCKRKHFEKLSQMFGRN